MEKKVYYCSKCASQVLADDINSLQICYDCQLTLGKLRNERKVSEAI